MHALWDENFYFFMTVMIVAALATPLTLLSAGTKQGAILAAPPSPCSPAPFSLLRPVRLACRRRHGHILPCTLTRGTCHPACACHAMLCHAISMPDLCST